MKRWTVTILLPLAALAGWWLSGHRAAVAWVQPVGQTFLGVAVTGETASYERSLWLFHLPLTSHADGQRIGIETRPHADVDYGHFDMLPQLVPFEPNPRMIETNGLFAATTGTYDVVRLRLVPHALVISCLPLLLVIGLSLVHWRRRLREPTDGSVPCPRCGYDLRAATSDRCPECGRVILGP